VLLGVFLLTKSLHANESLRLGQLKQRAEKAEKRGAWLEACRCYEELARRSRADASAREKYQAEYHRCLRRLHLFARTSDPAYRQVIARLEPKKALDAYEEIVRTLHLAYPDRSRAEFGQLLKYGLDEVVTALDDPLFRHHYKLNDEKLRPALITFRDRLAKWPVGKFSSAKEVREQVRVLVQRAASDGLPVERFGLGRALIMEFAAGACNALDEYSSFLTPTHLAYMNAPRRTIGAGLTIAADGDYFKITSVWPKSPASDGLLKENDRILSIGGASVKGLTRDEVEAKLRGKADEAVKFEYERGKDKVTVELIFREVRLPSVQSEVNGTDDHPIGYLRINYFNEDTLRDVLKEMGNLMREQQAPIEALVLDLRGNPGGLFHSAVQVAELFLPGGVISVGQSAHPDYNRTFKSDTPGSFQLPLVVLVDGDTASAAEVLAAALKESRPASNTWVMGQQTYGKGSVQCLFELKKPLDSKESKAAIRVTVAKLLSPSNAPISGKGVVPNKPLAFGVNARQEAITHLVDWLKEAEMRGTMMDRKPTERLPEQGAEQSL